MWWLLVGCADEPNRCGPEECAAFSSPAPAIDSPLAPWEEVLVGPLLADARSGIRPWDAEGIGICRGARLCDAFLGTEVGELPPGDYLVRAELRVPELGPPGTWRVRYRSQCEVVTRTQDGATRKKTETAAIDQTVRFSGPAQGWRIEPLQRIHSPSEGASTCTWTLEGDQPSGPISWSGSWSTPERVEGT